MLFGDVQYCLSYLRPVGAGTVVVGNLDIDQVCVRGHTNHPRANDACDAFDDEWLAVCRRTAPDRQLLRSVTSSVVHPAVAVWRLVGGFQPSEVPSSSLERIVSNADARI